MYLIDTKVISEKRMGIRADPGAPVFWSRILEDEDYSSGTGVRAWNPFQAAAGSSESGNP